MKFFFSSLAILVTFCTTTAESQDLSKIDRTIGQQPSYLSNEPKYCLLVFGPKAQTRVWLVLDLAYDPLREKPGNTESLYADINGNGNLTDAGEQIPVTVVTRKYYDFKFSNKEHEQHLPQFKVGDVKSRDGKILYKNLVVDVGWYVPGRPDREVKIAVDLPDRGRQWVGGPLLWFAGSPSKAPVVWFDGALTMRLAPSGMLHCPIDYTGKEPPPPFYEQFPLARGKTMPIRAEIGTAGVGFGTFTLMTCNLAPDGIHPLARVVFPHTDPKKPAIEVTVELTKRCCGTLFQGSISVPEEAALGKAKITLSFPGWHEGAVTPSVAEIEVSDKDTRPPAFREQ